jgi:DNA-binding SARP family transcriptional activator
MVESEAVARPTRWVYVIGEFRAGLGERVWTRRDVGSRKARTLLALLAVVGSRVVTMDQLVDNLWPDGPPRSPTRNVAALVSRLRAVLGADAIVGTAHGYRLGDTILVDLAEAMDLVNRAEARVDIEPDSALASAQTALGILGRGEVLADLPRSDMAESARLAHGDLLRRARHLAADGGLRVGDLSVARAAAATAASQDPLDETAHRALMRAHWAAGEPGQALLVFERLRTTLASQLGADPSPSTRHLHLAILQDGVAGDVAARDGCWGHGRSRSTQARRRPARLTPQQVDRISSRLGELLRLLHDADAHDRTEIYRRLGLRATTRRR